MDVKLKGCMTRLAQIVLLSIASYANGQALEYLSVDEISKEMERGQLSAEALVQHLLQRVDRLDKNGPGINAIIELNPDALAIARSLDRERETGHVRGPLHGIPLLLKDNIDTSDQMQTSAGSMAMIGQPAAKDAFIVQRLRAAGAIILGKTNLSEWANFRDAALPDGWSGRGGQTRNPHLLSQTPCGSSSGSGAAVAAGFAPLSVGTETAGSIVCPASLNGVVGLKPTVGLLSRSGIVPVTHKLDTPGPMARTVRDAALLLNAMTGNDAADPVSKPQALNGLDYTALLRPGSLVGRRLGYPLKFDVSGEAAQGDPQFSRALEVMQAAGATMIPIELNDPQSAQVDEALSMGIKRHLPDYLAKRTGLAIQSLEDLVRFNQHTPGVEGHGQSVLIAANDVAFDQRTYEQLWQTIQRENAAVIDDVLARHQLDAVVLDVGSPGLNIVPLAGYPSVMMPTGADEEGLPTSALFFGARWSEASLLALAYGYEQASHARPIPAFRP
ncbi:amidase family protein [Pseudomonas putida]|uniref:amidase family protein n=1 Tax=Pseudomonas putida TaxID=303 RepID=UPI00062B23F7|nr:amidase family protein [Pseudomonas putida]KKX64256.1 amidase [Pseudomonas putida]